MDKFSIDVELLPLLVWLCSKKLDYRNNWLLNVYKSIKPDQLSAYLVDEAVAILSREEREKLCKFAMGLIRLNKYQEDFYRERGFILGVPGNVINAVKEWAHIAINIYK